MFQLLLNFLVDANLPEIVDTVDKYASLLESIYVNPIIFFPMLAELIVAFIIRFFLWRQLSNGITKRNIKSVYMYIFSRCTCEWLCALIISYLIIKITFASVDSYIINYGIAPAIGFILGILIDTKIFMRISEKGEISKNPAAKLMISSSAKDNKKKGLFNKGNEEASINLTINNAPVQPSIENVPEHKSLSTIVSNTKYNPITEEDLENSNDPIELIRGAINNLQENQYNQAIELESQSNILFAIRDTMMTDKKFKLKRMMYECLDQGYATPDQNEKIEADYANYVALNGNGEVKKLYEEKYSKLSVHFDRKKKNVPVANDRRENINSYMPSYFEHIDSEK